MPICYNVRLDLIMPIQERNRPLTPQTCRILARSLETDHFMVDFEIKPDERHARFKKIHSYKPPRELELTCEADNLITPRQRDIINSFLSGKNHPQVAKALQMNGQNLKNHLTKISKKLTRETAYIGKNRDVQYDIWRPSGIRQIIIELVWRRLIIAVPAEPDNK